MLYVKFSSIHISEKAVFISLKFIFFVLGLIHSGDKYIL